MILRWVVVTSALVLGLAVGPSTRSVCAQKLTEVRSAAQEFSSADTEGFRVVTTRDAREGRTSERSIIEGPSINGGSTVLSGFEDQERQIGVDTSRRTRPEFVTDTNGRSSVVSTIEEHRTVRADGGERIVRDFTEPDVNGRARATRREHEETVAQERRVLTRDVSDGEIRSIETVYTADDAGHLVYSDRVVSREWTGPGGREHRTEETFSRDVLDEVRAAAPRLAQQVEVVRTNGLDGRWSTTRTVRKPLNGRMLVVERVVERSRPDGRGHTVVEQETQQLDVNGRLQTASVSRTRESTM